MERKKSYKGLVVWMVCFLASFFVVFFWGIDNTALLTRITMNIMTLSVAILAYIIYRMDCIYWYTGISYEEAAKVSEERRKEYAFKHWKLFGTFAVFYLVFSVVTHLFQVSYGVDIAFATIGICVAAVRTMWYKL